MIRFFFVFFLSTFCVIAEEFPYKAAIAEPEIVVRSGPGTQFYSTAKLRLGERVDVYYEENNWCAIRPPLGSFSWISAKYVELLSSNIGTVKADGLASRIGSDPSLYDGELCDTVQIKLKKDEKVLILDQIETRENASSPLWYKIAPPSGEFRWIPKNTLMRQKEENGTNGVTQVIYETETAPTSSETSASKRIVPVPKLQSPTSTHRMELPLRSSVPSVVSSKVENPEFQKAFEELKAETRNVLTRPTEDWIFQVLIERANELFKIAPTDNDMEKVYNIQESLQRTRNVRQEIAIRRQFRTSTSSLSLPTTTSEPTFASNSGAPYPAARTNLQMAPRTAYSSEITRVANNPNVPRSDTAIPLISPPTSPSILPPVAARNYDIRGRLGTFQPLPPGHPPYVIVNEKEEVICLITPANGVDLKPLLGKTIGINGILGVFVKKGQPNRRHITALEANTL